MMKKVMISAIAMTMAVSMVGCGQNTAGSNTASAEDTSAQIGAYRIEKTDKEPISE